MVTLRQAADVLTVPKDRIRGWVRRGRLTSAKIDGVHMVALADVRAIVAQDADQGEPVVVAIELASRLESMNAQWLERLDAERERSQDAYQRAVTAETRVEFLRSEIERLEAVASVKSARWWRRTH